MHSPCPAATELQGVRVFRDLEHVATDVFGVALQEVFDVVPVDRLATAEPEAGIDRGDAAQVAEIERGGRGGGHAASRVVLDD